MSVVQYNSSNGAKTNSVTNATYNYGTAAAGAARTAGTYTDGNVVSHNYGANSQFRCQFTK